MFDAEPRPALFRKPSSRPLEDETRTGHDGLPAQKLADAATISAQTGQPQRI